MQPNTNEPKSKFMARCQQSGRSQEACQVLFQREENKQLLWKKIDQKRRGFISFASVQFREAIRDSIEKFKQTLSRYSEPSQIEEISLNREGLEAAYDKVYLRVGRAFAKDSLKAINKASPVTLRTKQVEDMSEEELNDYFNELIAANSKEVIEERLEQVSATVRKDIKQIIEQGVREGASIDRISNLLDSVGKEEVGPKRARTIARTEVVSASNYGSLEGAKATSKKLEKEYLATRDGRTRAGITSIYDHLSPDGQRVELEGFFEVSGEQLKYPGDPAGSPGNIINCRCTQTYVPLD